MYFVPVQMQAVFSEDFSFWNVSRWISLLPGKEPSDVPKGG